jgi:hypothetical protein
MGAESGPSFFTDPATPPSIAAMLVTDAPPSFGSISVMPAVAPTVRTGPTTLFIRAARSGSASTQTISPYRPRLSVFVVPA